MESRINDKIDDVEQYLKELKLILPVNYEKYACDFEKRLSCERAFEKIVEAFNEFKDSPKPEAPSIEGWDGMAGERIIQVVCEGAAFNPKPTAL